MKVIENPKDSDWNKFWGRGESLQFSQVSWSKRRILEVLKPYVLAGQKALDAGCGSGFFSRFFCEHGMQTTAVDYSRQARLCADRVMVIHQGDMLNTRFRRSCRTIQLIFPMDCLNISRPDQDGSEEFYFGFESAGWWSRFPQPLVAVGIDPAVFYAGSTKSCLSARARRSSPAQRATSSLPGATPCRFGFPRKFLARHFGMLLTVAKMTVRRSTLIIVKTIAETLRCVWRRRRLAGAGGLARQRRTRDGSDRRR